MRYLLFRPAICFCLAAVLLFPSCSVSDTVVSRYNSDLPAHGRHLSHVGKTHWSFFWGILKKEDWAAGCSDTCANISKVRVVTNPGFIIVSALTLGIAVPQKVEWDCATPCRSTGTLGGD